MQVIQQTRNLVGAYALSLLFSVLRRLVPIILVCAAAALAAAAVPLALSLSPALLFVASPLFAVGGAAALLVAALRNNFGETWRARVDHMLGFSAGSWIPSFLLGSSSNSSKPDPETVDLVAVRTGAESSAVSSTRNSFDTDSLYSLDDNSYKSASANPQYIKVVLNIPLLNLCTHLYNSHKPPIPLPPSTSAPSSRSTLPLSIPYPPTLHPPTSDTPSVPVRLGRIHSPSTNQSSNAIEFKVLTLWRRQVKDLLVAKDYTRLLPQTFPHAIRIEKLYTNPIYSNQSFSARVVSELQRIKGVQSVGVWCLKSAQQFYEALGFRKAKEGKEGPWMVWENMNPNDLE
ncbi:hypothetical protein BCR33DRAFT_713433 [Rhizoclosmatium globosum]|uniref:Uncharacterized protein n=1 Tax=Rhizoclosmatium globosum TaxID=329046 RepID=A0A1Y2CS13_9FUNG|nr:hypothetical protein BCR33DRAFT_713433 [Rhizoclosmatium globosum]|eukprot:ORY49828.1 hypothetical protein BCR33DRAFT_713433 [Rhizoclosmatium globosum]